MNHDTYYSQKSSLCEWNFGCEQNRKVQLHQTSHNKHNFMQLNINEYELFEKKYK